MSSGGLPPTSSPGGLALPALGGARGTPEVEALLAHLVGLADRHDAPAQAELAHLLGAATTLDRLDPPAERNQLSPQDLRLARVLAHVRANRSPAAADTLATLARNDVLNADWRLQDALIRAFGSERPLRADAVEYLDAQSQPKSLNLQVVIPALIENESPPAMDLLGRKLEDPALSDNDKISWIRYRILPKRRSAGLLAGAGRWLADGRLAPGVKVALAEALFDYRPGEWGGTDLPPPPADAGTDPSAVANLRRIGVLVLASDYPAGVKQAVRLTLAKFPEQ